MQGVEDIDPPLFAASIHRNGAAPIAGREVFALGRDTGHYRRFAEAYCPHLRGEHIVQGNAIW
jgi:hypothetical protein